MISHTHKTVFVHIPKTGGQSVETVFLNDLGLKWRDRSVLLLRENKDRAIGPRRLAHLYGGEYVGLGHLPAEKFRSYTKFAIVRHPFDRVISEFRYRLGHLAKRPGRGAAPTFEAFLDWDISDDHLDISRHLCPQTRYVLDPQGTGLMDHIVRFETLTHDIAPVFAKVFGDSRPLPHNNRSAPEIPFGRDDLTQAQKDLLFARYRSDFEAFGYEP